MQGKHILLLKRTIPASVAEPAAMPGCIIAMTTPSATIINIQCLRKNEIKKHNLANKDEHHLRGHQTKGNPELSDLYAAKRTFDLAKHNLLVSRVLLLHPFQLLLRTGQQKV